MKIITEYIKGKNVLEIGGPSALLNTIYNDILTLDIINHPQSSKVHAQNSNVIHNLILGDATDDVLISCISKQYDVIITSHTLEHIANPLKALKLWYNLLNDNGVIINILPNKDHCWDRAREFTSFQHILDDYNNNTQESDMTHLHESACMVETRPNYYNDVGAENENRIIHHHCFDPITLKQLHEFVNYKTINSFIYEHDPLQLIYIGRK